MKVMNLFRAELYKMCHSQLLMLHILIPMLGIALFLSYYVSARWNEVEKVIAYLQVVACAFPMAIAMSETIIAEQEAKAGSYQTLLSVPCTKRKVHVIKLTIVSLVGLCAVMAAVCGFGILFSLFYDIENVGFNTLFYVKVALLLFASHVPLYMIQYVISFAVGKGVGLSVGLIGSVLVALLQTGLGDACWMYFPWGIPIHICSRYAYDVAMEIKLFHSAEVRVAFIISVIISIIMIGVIGVGSMYWEPHTEGEE